MRVLQVSMGEEFGGIEKLELDIMRNVSSDIKIDFLTLNSNIFKDYKNEIKKYKSKVYSFNISRNNIFNKIRYALKFKKFLKENKYDIVHINSSVFLFSFHISLICRAVGIEKIIAHSHSIPRIRPLKRFIINIFSPLYVKLVDQFISCSNEASSVLVSNKYKDRVIILNNGINIDNYKFNDKLRVKYRNKYNLDGKIVYGYVGRLDKVKNPIYLIDVFCEISKNTNNSFLIIVGDGSLKNEVSNKIDELNLTDKVLMLGEIDNVNEILNSMDVFIFPSISEGFGISLIEAQANGLYVYASSIVSSDVIASNRFKYFNLDSDIEDVVDGIINIKIDKDRNISIDKKFDIKNVCKRLENIYKN